MLFKRIIRSLRKLNRDFLYFKTGQNFKQLISFFFKTNTFLSFCQIIPKMYYFTYQNLNISEKIILGVKS
jgi:hypothetical protein